MSRQPEKPDSKPPAVPDLSNLIALCDLPDKLPRVHGRKMQLSTLHRWRLSGRLPCIQIGHRWFVSPDVLESLLTPAPAQPDGAPCLATRARPASAAQQDHEESLELLRRHGFQV